MLLVFAGWQNNPYDPGVHTLIGTCDTLEEARQGVEPWKTKERTEWFNILSAKHSAEYSRGIVAKATFWHQIAEFVPETGMFTVLEEVKAKYHVASAEAK